MRASLGKLATKNPDPTLSDVNTAIAQTGVKATQVENADALTAMMAFSQAAKGINVEFTPTIVVSNKKTGKTVRLVADQVTEEKLLSALTETSP